MPLNPSALLKLLRPKQWVKNTFVCAGVLFGVQFHNAQLLRAMAFTFIAFCLMGSTVYVLNDYLDRESDRRHPTKRFRPLAAGEVTAAQGFSVAVLACSAALAAAWLADIRVLL